MLFNYRIGLVNWPVNIRMKIHCAQCAVDSVQCTQKMNNSFVDSTFHTKYFLDENIENVELAIYGKDTRSL